MWDSLFIGELDASITRGQVDPDEAMKIRADLLTGDLTSQQHVAHLECQIYRHVKPAANWIAELLGVDDPYHPVNLASQLLISTEKCLQYPRKSNNTTP